MDRRRQNAEALAPKGRILRIVDDGYAYGSWRSVAIGAGLGLSKLGDFFVPKCSKASIRPKI